jgi:hypothetical protein
MNLISIIGLSLNTLGSFILAVSLNKSMKMINASLLAIEAFKDTYISGGDILSFIGMDEQRTKVFRKSKNTTIGGLILLMIGFLLQLLSLINLTPCI